MSTSKPTNKPEYTQGHHASVLKTHSQRTALNCATHVLPYLKFTDRILDIGCGPGSITVDLASYVPSGHVIGIDYSADVLSVARELASRKGSTNVTFETGDAYDLRWGDGEFDVVFVNQCLIHLKEPVRAMREMGRVVKGDGVVAIREGDFGTLITHPRPASTIYSWNIFAAVMRTSGSEPNAGRHLLSWALSAGFPPTSINVSANVEIESTPEEVKDYGENHADRLLTQGIKAVELGIATKEELEECAAAWRAWAKTEGAFHSITDVQILAGGRVSQGGD